MSFNYARLTEIAQVSDSVGAVYTNPSGVTSYIRTIILHNTNTSTEEVKLYTVPDNSGSVGTASSANKWYNESLGAGETRVIEFAAPGIILLDENDTIQAVTNTASKVTIQIYGAIE